VVLKVNLDSPGLRGLSFRVGYPRETLQLLAVGGVNLGPVVPDEANRIWKSDAETGHFTFAASTPTNWPGVVGTVVELTFNTLQAVPSGVQTPIVLDEQELVVDGYDNLVSPAVTLLLGPGGATPPTFASLRRTPAGQWEFEFSGELTAPVTLEASVNLADWQTMTTFPAGAAINTWTEPVEATHRARFFRTRQE
ncbi:MAG: hypothetical protein ACYC23_20625, partial [Limisphaerales bacterium]